MPGSGGDAAGHPLAAEHASREAHTVLPTPAHALGQGETSRPAPGLEPDEATTILPASDLDPAEAQTILPAGHRPPTPGLASRPLGGGETGPLQPGQMFGTRYHIIRLLGLGGMGAVYQAWDGELGVVVAIKVIRPEITGDPVLAREIERRFKRELLLARQVTHKNVVRIHDLGEIDGIKYITMTYVEGTDLASILEREGALPVARALRIARSVVSGLVAAHTAGVVHRDLKPANIMIGNDGEALIMDFGIARSTSAPAPASEAAGAELPADLRRVAALGAGATAAGSVLGTVEYMAPEQARGEAVDHRADIYAFGLIVYDMLSGGRRLHGENSLLELQARLAKAPLPLASLRPEIPPATEAVVSRCLEPDPGKRYQTTRALETDLERLDERGVPIPIKRVVGMRMLASVIVLLLGLAGGVWWYQRQFIPPPAREPVSVVIADIANATGDAAFSGTLEPMLKRALEGAGFISAYDRAGIIRILGVRPPERLDEAAAHELAVKQGLGVVLAGSIEPDARGGYRLSLRATRAVTGEVVTTAQGTATSKDQVLNTATRLIARARNALGDEASESAQLFAMTSLSATSLDVVRLYAAAQEAASTNRFDEARQHLSKAVELDPNFGVGYQLLAVASRNLGRLQDAEKYINEALRHLDGMTERERFSTRGYYFRITGDYAQCVKEYGELVARYAADVAAHNQHALCLSLLRRLPEAVSEMRQVVALVPNRPTFRDNLALYASYAGDFDAGEEAARAVPQPDAYALLALAFARLGRGELSGARQTYEQLASVNPSFAASGLGDLASLEGRFSDARRLLEEGAAADVEAKNPDRAAAKFAALAHAELSRGRLRPAVDAADKALANSRAVKIRFLAARALAEAGEIARARPIAAALGAELQAEPQAYAKLIEGQIALKNGDARQAVKVLAEANGLFETWIGHFELGRAYLAAGAFTQADAELDRCLKRRGEALSLFLDEEPTYAFLPAVYYYQGRVREALKSAGFAESYRQYLAFRGQSNEDPLLSEVRQRAGSR